MGIGNYGEMDMAYDATANSEGFTSFNPYGGWGNSGAMGSGYVTLYGASSGQTGGQGGHKTVAELKKMLMHAIAKLKTASTEEKPRIKAHIRKIKAHLAKIAKHHGKHARRGLRGSSGHGLRGSSGPGIHGSSGRSHHIQRRAIKHLRQGQQQGEEAYSEEDSGEYTDADLSMVEDGGDSGEDMAGWGNWGMGQAFGSTYVTLYGGYGAVAHPGSHQLADQIRHAKGQLAHLEVVKKTAKGDAKKHVKEQIHQLKKHIRELEKLERQTFAQKKHFLGIGKQKDAHLHSTEAAKRAHLARLALLRRKKHHPHLRHPLVRHGMLRYPGHPGAIRPGQIPMAPGPFGPQPPPGVLLQGQRPGASAFYPHPRRGRGGGAEAGGDVNDYFDTGAGADGADPSGGDDLDMSDSGSASDTDWGEIAKYGLGAAVVIGILVAFSKRGKGGGSKKSSSGSSSSYGSSSSSAAGK